MIAGYLEDVGSFNVKVSAVADVPSGRQNSSWLDRTVRRGHDVEYTTGCSKTACPSSIPLVNMPRIRGLAVVVQLL